MLYNVVSVSAIQQHESAISIHITPLRRAAAKRSYPTTEVRGSGREYQTATAQERPAERSYRASEVSGGRSRGDTQRPRSGATAGRSYPRPHARGQGQRPGGATPHPRPRVVARKSNPMPEARGGSLEDQPHVQGAVAAWAQEGLEELSHVEGQEGWR